MTNADTLCEELTRINEVVSAARDLVADGQLINLAPLEAEVGRVCDQLQEIAAGEAGKVKPVLLALMDELDRLAAEMRTRQAEYEEDLRTLASHKNAARAYRPPEAKSSKSPSPPSGIPGKTSL